VDQLRKPPGKRGNLKVADAAQHGIERVCASDDLVVRFLAHTGLSLDPRAVNPTRKPQYL
jgi:hypothetical protein